MWKLNMVIILLIAFGGFGWCVWRTMQAQEAKQKE
jgi:predicted negative regulator of RcsB-dependent stress response